MGLEGACLPRACWGVLEDEKHLNPNEEYAAFEKQP